MECSKCGKKLTFYDGICCCMDCKKYFCGEEGHILKDKQLIEVVKGTNYRIIYDFLCSDCENKERNKDEILKEQTERLTKAREEKDRAEMLKAQRLHSSDNWEVEFEEAERLPEIGEINSIERGFRGIVRSCSVYDEFYGSKWPSKDTKIYLIFTHYKKSGGRLIYEKTEYYCLGCVKRFIKNWWGDLNRSFLTSSRDKTFKEKFPDIEFNKE